MVQVAPQPLSEPDKRLSRILCAAAHKIREMQMYCYAQERNTTEKRAPLWRFEQLGTVRRKLIQRAGRLTKPQGKLTLTMSANPTVKSELLHYLEVLKQAA